MNAIDSLMVLDLETEIEHEKPIQILKYKKIYVLKAECVMEPHYLLERSRKSLQIPWIDTDGFKNMPQTKLRCLL